MLKRFKRIVGLKDDLRHYSETTQGLTVRAGARRVIVGVLWGGVWLIGAGVVGTATNTYPQIGLALVGAGASFIASMTVKQQEFILASSVRSTWTIEEEDEEGRSHAQLKKIRAAANYADAIIGFFYILAGFAIRLLQPVFA